MSLLNTIARKALAGLSPAAIALELQLSELWVERVMGADGFQSILEQARRSEPPEAAEDFVGQTGP